MTEQIKMLMDELEKYRKYAQKLVGIIANTGMVSGYQRIANQERRAAIIWNILAIIGMIGLITFAIYSFTYISHDSFNWTILVGRIFVAGSFGAFAAYAARQANIHQQLERYNRKMELELASIDPYLASLPQEVRDYIKGTLAERLFAQNNLSGINISPQPSSQHAEAETQQAQQEIATTSTLFSLVNQSHQIIAQLLKKNNES